MPGIEAGISSTSVAPPGCAALLPPLWGAGTRRVRVSIMSSTSMGLATCAFMPLEIARRRSSSMALAVMATMGKSGKPSARMARVAS
ncbi:hypothetical protein D3C81_1226220 [compost metagenome]